MAVKCHQLAVQTWDRDAGAENEWTFCSVEAKMDSERARGKHRLEEAGGIHGARKEALEQWPEC